MSESKIKPVKTPASAEPKAAKNAKRLMCVKEAVMPGRGHFQPGDFIDNPELIAYIGDHHPFFTVVDANTNQEGN